MLKDKVQSITINESPQKELKIEVPEVVYQNPLEEVYQATKRAILTIKEDESTMESLPFFKTIAIDTGQFARLVRSENTEFETAFPAVFIHFINVRYLVQQQRIGEGRATMRIWFILNTLNNQDTEQECAPFHVFQRINMAIQEAKNREPALNERCNLSYFDMPATTNMLQAYWVDYEVWFRDMSTWKYKDWVEKYLVMPPFTNHSDAPEHDEERHGNHPIPKHKEVTGFVPSVGEDEEEKEEDKEETDKE